jgi:uncharacterized protein YjiS (DUF1127 family)
LHATLRAIARWWEIRRAIARLSRCPDRMLRDIGVSRAGIDWAVRHGRREESRARRSEDAIYTDEWSIQNEVHP